MNPDAVCAHEFHLTENEDCDIQVVDGWMREETLPACSISEDRMWPPLRWLNGHAD